jgi:RHS repeat-associated protein
MPMQGWCMIKRQGANYTFEGYNTSSSPSISTPRLFSNFSKTISFPKRAVLTGCASSTSGSNCVQSYGENYESPKKFFSGDFNGDGITDVIAVEDGFINQRPCNYCYPGNTRGCQQGSCYSDWGYNEIISGTYLVDLKYDAPATPIYLGELPSAFYSNTRLEIVDFNGDGKSDILLEFNGLVRVYSLNNLNALVKIVEYSEAGISTDKPLLIGDYNGDGKMDFCIPQVVQQDSWNFYFSNGKDSFVAKNGSIGINYVLPTCDYINDYREIYYFASDVNNDGKTDIMTVGNRTTLAPDPGIGSSNRQEYICQPYYSGTQSISTVLGLSQNINVNAGNIVFKPTFNQEYNSYGIKRYPIISFFDHNNNRNKYEFSLLQDNKIITFKQAKDATVDSLLKSVTDGNSVKESITYGPLKYDPNISDEYGDSHFKPSTFTSIYPDYDIEVAPTFRMVTKLERKSATETKKQLFNYFGAVSNMQGLGFLGFKATARTNWFDANNQVITSVSKNNTDLRGANTENYTVLGYVYAHTNSAPTNFITKSTTTYNDNPLQANKVFKLKVLKSEQFNKLEDTSSETTILETDYDQYNNPKVSTTLVKQAGTTQQTTTTTLTYDNLPTGTPYIIGRVNNKKQSIAVTGDTMTSEEQYGYSANNLLTQIRKKGHDTEFITEDNVYDVFGNITTKTISATGITPRVTSYKYDPSGRFLTESTDIEGLVSKFSYNANTGLLDNETNPYGLITTYGYDSWFRKTRTTDYLGKSVATVYTRSGNNTIVTTTGDDGSASTNEYDDLGRTIKSGTKDLNGNWVYTSAEYDIYDRAVKTYEPYYTSPSQFSTTKYDAYGRMTEMKSYTGKTTTTTYDKLITKVDDGTKQKEITKNALGNMVKMTDTPGGTINYTYFANNNLKSTNYDGIETIIEQDGWGRKTKLIDPSAGENRYSMNILGEIVDEITQKGNTSYSYDNFGKITQKRYWNTNNTDLITDYTYNPTTKLLTKMTVTDNKVTPPKVTTYDYSYDDKKRLNETIETSPNAKFRKYLTFDAFGRVDTELYYVDHTATGKTTQKKVRYTYKNGAKYQIIDDATNAVLWQTNTVNARGQVTESVYSGGVGKQINAYDDFGYPTKIDYTVVSGVNANTTPTVSLNNVFEPKLGLLSSRTNNFAGVQRQNEVFTYDSQERLLSTSNPITVNTPNGPSIANIPSGAINNYDEKGRITQFTGTMPSTTFNYDIANKPYQLGSMLLPSFETEAYKASNIIFRDNMETNAAWTVPSWNAVAPLPTVTYDTTQKRLGYKSLKITNSATTERVLDGISVAIDNAADTNYNFSAWVYSNGPQPEILLLGKTATETGYNTTASSVVTNTVGKWVLIQKTFRVPANIKSLFIRLDNNGAKNGGQDVWFDNVTLSKNAFVIDDYEVKSEYNAFNQPISIERLNSGKYFFEYNTFQNRSDAFYGNDLETNRYNQPYRKHYSADGSTEIKYNVTTSQVEFLFYIDGDGYSAPLVCKSDGTTQEFLYLQRDYQGSIVGISNAAGQVLERRTFDAWGVMRVTNANANYLSIDGSTTLLDRGYTGHEHLHTLRLINMNARIYDPTLRRFLSPDNYVQDPSNTQNYNRYAYCWNNPLKFTDKDGNWIWIVVAAVVGGVVNWATHGARFDMEGLKAFGIGAAAGTIGALTGGAAFAAAGGAAGGIGGFFAGAVGGAVGSASSQLFQGIANNIAFGDPMMSGIDFIKGVIIGAALGGVINGTIAKVNGLTFWRGTLPKVQAITLPSPAGLSKVGSTSQEPKVDVKLPKTAEVSTTSTTQANTTNNVTITENVDGSGFKVDGLGIEKTPVGSQSKYMNAIGNNKPATIDGVNYSGHALDQMQGRGILSPSVVKDAIANPLNIFQGNTSNELLYIGKNGIRVVTNTAGKVITVY